MVSYEGRMAAVYDGGRHLLPEAVAVWRRSVDDLVPPAPTVLDVGAGTGRFAELFAERGATVLAVEPAGRMRTAGSGKQRRNADQLVAHDLTELAERVALRAVSTFELLSDESFERGLAALRADAASHRPAPVVAPVDLAVFCRP